MTTDEYRRLVEAGVIDKVEFLDPGQSPQPAK